VVLGLVLLASGRSRLLVLLWGALVLGLSLPFEGVGSPGWAVALESRAARRLYPLLVLLAALLAGLPSLSADFLGDDFGWVFLFQNRRPSEILVLRDISQGVWGGLPLDELRPLFPLSFRLNASLFGADPAGFHLANILLHAVDALLVFAIARLATGRAFPAFMGGLFFSFAPGHAEAVSWVSGRVDLLPTAFYLGAVAAFLGFRKTAERALCFLALLLMALGLFSKEILLTLPFLLVILDLWDVDLRREAVTRRGALRFLLTHLPFVLLAVGYLVLRRVVFGNFAREGRMGGWLLPRFLAGQAADLRPFLPPFDLAHRGSLPHGALLFGGIVFGLLLVRTLALLRERNSVGETLHSMALLGSIWYAVTALPLLVTYSSPRHLYLPSAGPLIALALLLFPRRDRVSLGGLLAGLTLLLAFCSGLERHEAAWIRAGALSRGAREQIEALAPRIPAGGLVVLTGVPNELGETIVWDFALPFALRKPFTHDDLYSRFSVLESPGIYCCPVGDWFRVKRGLLVSLFAGPGNTTLEAYSLHWNEARGRIVGTFGSFRRDELKARIAALQGKPVARPPSDAPEAARLMPALLEALRGLCGESLEEPSGESR
jgi:hypothetical protein